MTTRTLKTIAIGVLSLVTGCSEPEIAGDVIQRIERPGDGVVAIVTRMDRNATVAIGYRVYLQMLDGSNRASEVLKFDKGSPPKVSWTGPKNLLLKVDCGQIYHFANFADVWPKGHAEQYERIVIALDNHGICN